MSGKNTGPNARPQALRLCHLADIHLGYRRYNRLTKTGFNQREADVNVAFREALDRIVALKPDITLIAGDLFHTIRPSNSILSFAFREIRRLVKESQAPVVIVAGNHETPRRVDSGSPLRLLAEIDGVYIADSRPEQFVFRELNLSVQCLPHAALAEGSPSVRANDGYKFNVLLLHGQVDETWMSDFGGATVHLKRLAAHEWDYIALGHVHVMRKIDMNAAYSGSIEHTASNIWGEAQANKGLLEVQLPGGKHKFHSLTSPREVVLTQSIDALGMSPDELQKVLAEQIDQVAGGIDGKLVRLEVRNVPREVFSQLDHREIRKWRSRALNLTLDLRAPMHSESNAGKLPRSDRRSLEGELRNFCGQWKETHVTREDLQKVLTTYYEKVEAEDEAAQP